MKFRLLCLFFAFICIQHSYGSHNMCAGSQYTIRPYNKNTDQQAVAEVLNMNTFLAEKAYFDELTWSIAECYAITQNRKLKEVTPYEAFLNHSVFQGEPLIWDMGYYLSGSEIFTEIHAHADVICLNNWPVGIIFYYFVISKAITLKDTSKNIIDEFNKLWEGKYKGKNNNPFQESASLHNATACFPFVMPEHESAQLFLIQHTIEKFALNKIPTFKWSAPSLHAETLIHYLATYEPYTQCSHGSQYITRHGDFIQEIMSIYEPKN